MQKLVRDRFPFAYYVHCYAHQLNLILAHVSSNLTKVRIFFANLSAFSLFFSLSPKRTSVLESLRLPRTSATRWNFRSRLVNTVIENRNHLMQCFSLISERSDFDGSSVHSAIGLRKLLCDSEFLFFLSFFHSVMMHVDILSAQLQKRNSDPVSVRGNVNDFCRAIEVIRRTIPDIWSRYQDSLNEKIPTSDDHVSQFSDIADQACQLIVADCSKGVRVLCSSFCSTAAQQ